MALSGQITVTTAGTAVQGPDVPGLEFWLIAHPDNTDDVWVGNDGAGDVTKDNGFPLENAAAAGPGNEIRIRVSNLNVLYFDSEVNGEKICWLKYR